MEPRTPVRLVICVDGTLCDPDGPVLRKRAHGNITNVYRLCASVQEGLCKDINGKSYQQEKRYFHGIASENNRTQLERIKEGIFGKACIKQVRDVYRECCRLHGPEDEVWLYGFSRGAWVVRAVAGLLHHIRALPDTATDQIFEQEYEEALEVYRMMRAQDRTGQGQIHEMLARTHSSPTIKFVGVFDTVKAVDDSHLFDISFNDSINHMRHALALNEDRIAMLPEYVYPTFSHNMTLPPRTFAQSWFVGAHIDIGGSSEEDGLSLYPLQWMLLESRDVGLCFKFDGSFGGRAKIDDPLKLTGLCDNDSSQIHTTTTENSLEVKMIDIGSIHTRDGYAVRINRTKSPVFWKRNHRSPFNSEGRLEGYWPFAPQGTIIHPSIYLIMDENMSAWLDIKNAPFCRHLEKWRHNTLGWDDNFPKLPNLGFWNKRQNAKELQYCGAIRILVCGNTGVGKSTLINKVFGVADGQEVTETSHSRRGVHNVREEFTWPNRPGLVIHDSRGFEAGSTQGFEDVEEFLREKSTAIKADDFLHAIWFCLETDESRPTQIGTESLFRAIDLYARDVPVLVIATKRDRFLGTKQLERRRQLENQNESFSFKSLDEHAEHELQKQLGHIKEEILKLQWGRVDACVAVSKYEDKSIRELIKINAECFSHERTTLLYIRTQVAHIDLKVDLAVCATMRIYNNILARALYMGPVSRSGITNRFSSAIELFGVIINCFGMPSVTPEVAYDTFKSHLFKYDGGDLAVLFAECMATHGLLVPSLFLAPVAPVAIPLTLGAVVPLGIPVAECLLLKLACDLILVFSHCFRNITQPKVKDLQQSVMLYQKYFKHVHLRISKTLPKRNMVKFFRVGEVEEAFKEIINHFRWQMMEEPTSSAPQTRSSLDISDLRPSVTLPSRSLTSPTANADVALERNEEGSDRADILEQDDREVVEETRRILQENGYQLSGPG